MKDLSTATPPSLRLSDFPDEISYEDWKLGESQAIKELTVTMIQSNPALAQSQPVEILHSLLSDSTNGGRPDLRRTTSDTSPKQQRRKSEIEQLNIAGNGKLRPDAGRRISWDEEKDDFPQKSMYTFIPEDQRAYYKRLLEVCLKAQRQEEPTEEEYDQGGLLSRSTRSLLNECAVRWRVHPAARISLLLDVVRGLYDHEDLGIQDITEAFTIADNWDYSSWPNADVPHLPLTGLME